MRNNYDVVLRLDVDPKDSSRVIKVGVKRPRGELRWIAEWLCGSAVTETSLTESVQVADDLWTSLVGSTVGIQGLLI